MSNYLKDTGPRGTREPLLLDSRSVDLLQKQKRWANLKRRAPVVAAMLAMAGSMVYVAETSLRKTRDGVSEKQAAAAKVAKAAMPPVSRPKIHAPSAQQAPSSAKKADNRVAHETRRPDKDIKSSSKRTVTPPVSHPTAVKHSPAEKPHEHNRHASGSSDTGGTRAGIPSYYEGDPKYYMPPMPDGDNGGATSTATATGGAAPGNAITQPSATSPAETGGITPDPALHCGSQQYKIVGC